MKLLTKSLVTALALAAASALVIAQEQRPGGPGGGPRMVMPIIAALDANGDGVIDATEIANASAALKKLDKNGDGKLTPDEYRPQRPGGRGGAGGGPDGAGNGDGAPRRRPPAE